MDPQQPTFDPDPGWFGLSSYSEAISSEANRVTFTFELGEEDLFFDIPEAEFHRPDGYEIIDEMGRGGMAVVYMARELKLNRVVALKMLRSGRAAREELARFRHEAETIARMTHPNIVRIHGVGEHLGIPFLSLEYCDGGNLDEFIHGRPQPEMLSARIVETIARAVQAAHEQGIVHRDLKPSNILLTSDTVPKVTDFGVAKFAELGRPMTQTGVVMGTPCYTAPEQARGDRDLTHAVDVYALGAILYELLTGRPPHNGPTPVETMRLVADATPLAPSRLRPGLSRDLEVICLRCLEKTPSRRYSSAQELADDLRRYQCREPIKARPVYSLERLYWWCRRNPRETFLLTMVTLFVAVSLVAIVSNWKLRESRKEEVDRHQEEQLVRFDAALEQYRRWRQQALQATELPERARLHDLARVSLDQAEWILRSGSTEDREKAYLSCQAEARADRLNEELIRRLDAVRLEVSLAGLKEIALHDGLPHDQEGVDRYLRCLREYGIDPATDDLGQLTARLRHQPESVRARVADALDHLAILSGPTPLRRQALLLGDIVDPANALLRKSFLENDLASLTQRGTTLATREDDPRTVRLLANFLIAAGGEGVGEEILVRAVERRPRDFWLSHDLAVQLLVGKRGDLIQSVRTMSVARALRAEEHAVDFHLGVTLKLAHRDAEAIRALQLLLEDQPQLDEARDVVARAYADLGESRACLDWLRQARTVSPESILLAYRLGVTLQAQNRFDEANTLFEELLAMKAVTADDTLLRALALERLGRREESIRTLEDARSQFPNHYRITYQLAQVYSRYQNAAREKELFQQAAELEPSLPSMHRKLGETRMAEGDYPRAITYLEAADRLEPGRLDTLVLLAKCLALDGKANAGRERFRTALDRQPGNSPLALEYALFLRDVDRLDESRSILAPLCDREPKHLGAHRGLATVLQKSYRFDEAYLLLLDLSERSEGDRSALERVEPWLREAEALCRRETDWQRYVSDRILPEDPWEILALARFTDQGRQQSAMAVEIFDAAFSRYTRFRLDANSEVRIDAARIAMRAARDLDSPPETRSRFRDLAREWLQAEAGLIEQRVASGPPHEVTAARQRVDGLLGDPDFSEIRDVRTNGPISEEELLAWQPIWETLRKCGGRPR